jgi:ABC-type transporter Mla subunit MlaD
VDLDAIARAQQRIEEAAAGRPAPAALDAALERARSAVEALASTTARLEAGLPEAIQEGLRQQFRPSARHLAEVRGLMNQVLRRLERIEGDLLAERHARVDDLALLVDLVASGWRALDERLARLEAGMARDGGVVYRLEDRQAG